MFIWNAILVRNIIDWASEVGDITFPMLRTELDFWLEARFSTDQQYHAWKAEIATGGDYRHYISNIRYLLAKHLEEEDISMDFLNNSYLHRWKEPILDIGLEMTLVTPTAYHWFKPLFGKQLYTFDPKEMLQRNALQPACPPKRAWEMFDEKIIEYKNGIPTKVQVRTGVLSVGDFVEINIKSSNSGKPEEIWIARIIGFEGGAPLHFRLVWMYSIEHTFLFDADRYTLSPFELFYSLHCECKQSLFSLSTVKCKVDVELSPQDIKNIKTYFCRYFYDENGGSFIDLAQAHICFKNSDNLLCNCSVLESCQITKRKLLLDREQIGQAFSLDLSSSHPDYCTDPVHCLLTIGQLLQYHPQTESFSFRVFPRIREVPSYAKLLKELHHPGTSELNELLYSPRIVQCKLAAVIAPCHIEFVSQKCRNTSLPINLRHRGAGNQFLFTYITNNELSTIFQASINQMGSFKRSFPQRNQLVQGIKPLRALDLFSGSGSLGLGIGDGGFASSRWAVDFEPTATEAYRLNNPTSRPMTFFTESVNRSLNNIFREDANYPKKGDVDLILAGTPCQGFSSLNRNKNSGNSIINNSMIASLASYVDHLRPTHVLMEQITSFANFKMTPKGQKGSIRHPFRQLMRFFLSLDYQIRILVLSASNHGSCQVRNRIFIWCTSRTNTLPIHPTASHLSQKLFKFTIAAPENQRIQAHQSPLKAALPPITIRDMIGDLPPLGLSPRPQIPGDVSFHTNHNIHSSMVEILDRIPLGFGMDNLQGLQFRTALSNSTVRSTIILTFQGRNPLLRLSTRCHKRKKSIQES
ncbi:hypothetical protein DSO57_1034339 [Entomophthora muscae]|uniref:Uncharacterized protein n=1 Tax=Entomophthora muscae TaxID=34485 RepID=A0ACC2SCS8_9FUNG|nr:hypothetical protein DSO57_1034339 [Entomophthora muscae]